MKKSLYIMVIAVLGLAAGIKSAEAATISERLSGRILLSVQQSGEAWYVNPPELKRYFLGRPADAFAIMRQLGLGITETDFQQLATPEMAVSGNAELAKRLSGRIVLQVERNGEAWYINPVNLRKYYLGRPGDAFAIMRQLGLGITVRDLALIRRANASGSISAYNSYQRRTVATRDLGSFTADVVTIDLANPNLKIRTLAASSGNCASNCPAKSLAEFYEEGSGFAAMNGTYFDTSAAKRNYYFFPLYDSLKKVFINEDQLKYWTTGPIMAFDTDNKFYYFKQSTDFKSVAHFEATHGVKLGAAMGNKPRLIEEGLNYLIEWEVDNGQRTVKTTRHALGYANNKLYLVVAHKATVPDLAQVMQAIGSEYAINLDGGGSTALMYDGSYVLGPGRNIPNAIVFSEE